MTLNDVSKVLALIGSLSACLVTLLYAFTNQRRASKRLLRLFESIAWLWLSVIYISAIVGNTDPLFLSGVYTRAGVIALTGLFVGEVLADWKRQT